MTAPSIRVAGELARRIPSNTASKLAGYTGIAAAVVWAGCALIALTHHSWLGTMVLVLLASAMIWAARVTLRGRARMDREAARRTAVHTQP